MLTSAKNIRTHLYKSHKVVSDTKRVFVKDLYNSSYIDGNLPFGLTSKFDRTARLSESVELLSFGCLTTIPKDCLVCKELYPMINCLNMAKPEI